LNGELITKMGCLVFMNRLLFLKLSPLPATPSREDDTKASKNVAAIFGLIPKIQASVSVATTVARTRPMMAHSVATNDRSLLCVNLGGHFTRRDITQAKIMARATPQPN